MLGQQVSGDAGRTGDEDAESVRPFALAKLAMVQPDISAPGLPARGKREFVLVSGQVAEAGQFCSRPLVHDALGVDALPGERAWLKLELGRVHFAGIGGA